MWEEGGSVGRPQEAFHSEREVLGRTVGEARDQRLRPAVLLHEGDRGLRPAERPEHGVGMREAQRRLQGGHGPRDLAGQAVGDGGLVGERGGHGSPSALRFEHVGELAQPGLHAGLEGRPGKAGQQGRRARDDRA